MAHGRRIGVNDGRAGGNPKYENLLNQFSGFLSTRSIATNVVKYVVSGARVVLPQLL